MYPFKRILVPTDFSLCAEAAFRHASYLAQPYQAEVHLLHVETARSRRGQPGPGAEAVATWSDRVGTPAYTEHGHDLLLRRAFVRHRDPVTAILDYAGTSAPDLIVMGAHGDRGAGHFLQLGAGSSFLGHTTEQVVRHAPCPVFHVAMRAGRSPDLVRRILVPVDLSPLSLLALACARNLAARYDAHLHLLRVVESPSAQEKHARVELLAVFDKTKGAEVPVGFHVTQGRPVRKIQGFIAEHDVDVVVLGAHSDLHEDVLGTVAERIVRTAPCSVFTVREGTARAQRPRRFKGELPTPSVFL